MWWGKSEMAKESKAANELDYDLPLFLPTNKPDATIIFSVGRSDDDRITLTIGDAYGSKTMLMTPVGVRRVVALLDASLIDEDYNEDFEEVELPTDETVDGC